MEKTLADPETAPISPKLKALLAIAAKVREDGKLVTAADVERARAAGANDVDIHDAVLVAAAFSMYNRYVDGLATFAPPPSPAYDQIAKGIVEHGYAAASPAPPTSPAAP